MFLEHLKRSVSVFAGALAAGTQLFAGPFVNTFGAVDIEFRLMGPLILSAGVVWVGVKLLWGHSDQDALPIVGKIVPGGILLVGVGAVMSWLGFT